MSRTIEKPKSKAGRELAKLEDKLDSKRGELATVQGGLRDAQIQVEQIDRDLRAARRDVELGEATANAVSALERRLAKAKAAADPRQHPRLQGLQDACRVLEGRIDVHIRDHYADLATELRPAEEAVVEKVERLVAEVQALPNEWQAVSNAHRRLLKPVPDGDVRSIPPIDSAVALARAARDLEELGIPRPAPRPVEYARELTPATDARGRVMDVDQKPSFERFA